MLNKTISHKGMVFFAAATSLLILALFCVSERQKKSILEPLQAQTQSNTSPRAVQKPSTAREKSEMVAKKLIEKEAPSVKLPLKQVLFDSKREKETAFASSGLKKDRQAEGEHETPEERAEWSKERNEYEFNMLKDPKTGRIPRDAAKKALEAAMEAQEFKIPVLSANGAELAAPITVVPRGPNNFGGRTRAIAFDKRNSQIMLAGSVSGGVFRTTNGGTSWTRVSPIGAIHNATALVQDPRSGSENTWYYGTGESSGNSASSVGSSYLGFGIWKSTDNGVNWTALSSTQSSLEVFDHNFDYVHRLVVNPTNGYVYAAASNTIMQSMDGGVTWTTVLGTLANSRYTDIIVTPTGRFYAAFDGREADNGVWTSTTGASGTWTCIAGTGAATNHANWNAQNAYRRVVLAYAPSNTNIIFALYYNNLSSTCAAPVVEAEFFKWDQSTTTWTDLSANLPDEAGCSQGNDPFAVQGGYDLVVAVKPNDVNTVFIGGTNVYRSTNGFTSTAATTRIGGYASTAGYALYANHHSDIHCFTFAPGDNNTLYCGDDGGIQKADITGAVNWTSLNNDYVTYQYYYVDINPNSTAVTALAGGAQDNGTTICESGTTHFNEWSGDGCQTQLISYTSASNYAAIVSSQSGSIYRTNQSFWWDIKPAGSGLGIFVTYFHLDQDNTNLLYYVSGGSMYRTRIASTLTATTVTSDPTTGWESMSGVGSVVATNIRCMATSRDNAYANADYTASNTNRVLYIGTEGGLVYRLNNPAFVTASTAPVAITPSGSSGMVSSIAVNPFDDNEIMVTYSNYGVNSVYRTANAKAATPTWTNIEGPATGAVALGSARSCIITRIGSTMTYIVGNSTGLFSTQALSGATTVWDRVGSSSINFALCSSMRLRVTDNIIALGTHGNGAFELQMPAAVLPVELLSFEGKPEVQSNQLTWNVANEVQFKGYTVERSVSGKDDFKEVGSLPARNVTGHQTYIFDDVDNAILKTSTPQYYRLRMDDLGQTNPTYSKTIAIQRTLQKSKDWVYTLSPNPASVDLTVDFVALPEASTFNIQIVDIVGRIFLTMNKRAEELSSTTLKIPIQSLSAGTYFLKIQSADGTVKNEKFVKF